MAIMTIDTPRSYELGIFQEVPMIAAGIIYEGAAVGAIASGLARPLVAGDPFLGFANRQADNRSGLAGAIRAQVIFRGQIVLPVTGVTGVGDLGRVVYASNDATYTLATLNNSPIGTIVRHISGTSVVVDFAAVRPDARIVDPTGGATVDVQARGAIVSIIDALERARILIPA